jgi:predicted ATPase with chaperone activity
VSVLDLVPTMPAAPKRAEDVGVSSDLILRLVTKTLHFGGELRGTEIAARLGVPFFVIEGALERLKTDRYCEIVGGASVGAPAYMYRLTDAGRVRAALFLEDNHYVGAVPVPLEQYQAYMARFAARHSVEVTRDLIRVAFSHLVLNDRVLDQLGPAIAAWHSLFIYGPPGNGKTVIAQAIRNVLHGDIAIPYALSVQGRIVRLFDPVNHERVQDEITDESLAEHHPFDHRWVRCRRPLVTVGGELTMSALEIGYTEGFGFYTAPLQALANGGVLVIDDFGRQAAPPRDLLNRWIVPLESRVDYLTLRTGQKFQLPFEVFVVFATNIKPGELIDEAFLRRIQYKVLAESPTPDEFAEIFRNYCASKQLSFDADLPEYVINKELRPRGLRPRGCHPRDLIEHALAIAKYLGRPRALTPALLAESCASYFVEDRDIASA